MRGAHPEEDLLDALAQLARPESGPLPDLTERRPEEEQAGDPHVLRREDAQRLLAEIRPDLVSAGTLTMRFGDDVRRVPAGSAVRVAPATPRSHRNEGDEPVEMWAVSRRLGHGDAVKIDAFWAASPDAVQERS